MASSKNRGNSLIPELASDLDETARLTKSLAEELKEFKTAKADVETELKVLNKDLTKIAEIVRDGEIPLVTKIALQEEKIKQIEKELKQYKNKNEELIKYYTEEQELVAQEKSKAKVELIKIIVGIIVIVGMIAGIIFVV